MSENSRVHFRSAAMGGLIVGVMLLAMPPAVAAVAGLVLGTQNTANSRTVLTSGAGSSTLRLVNNGAGSALSLVAEAGEAPFKVDSGTKVQKLNADRVDGWSAHQLLRVAFANSDNLPSVEGDVLSVQIKAPRDGFLVISGGVNGSSVSTTGSYMWCNFELDGQEIVASERLISNKSFVASGDTETIFSFCESSVTVPVSAGTHSVNLHWETTNPNPSPKEATLTALYVPFDGDGKRP